MYKDSLFELIRKGEVVIWAGAGMSKYAGYPSGEELGKILIERLSSKEKRLINRSLPLPNLAEEYCRLKGGNRSSLIEIIKEIFSRNPNSIDTHRRVATIPHFKTIITTNYDTLFEKVYGNDSQMVYSIKQIPHLDERKVHIFKVHGDLNDPDSIIITLSDYDNFFKDNRDNNLFWSVIRERLATNSVLFLGYNIEDPNVSVIFDRITEALGEDRRKCFFVAPGLPDHKVGHLLRKGIHYINSTAEELILELIPHLEENITADFEDRKISAETYRYFLLNYGILPELRADEKKYEVTSLKGINTDITGIARFTFKNEKRVVNELNDLVKGKRFGALEVSEGSILNADISFGGVKFKNFQGILKIEFKSNPNVDSLIDIRFEDGFEYLNIPVKLYKSPLLFEIHLEFDNADVKFNVNLENSLSSEIKFNYQHKEICKNVKSEVDFFTFLIKLCEGKKITVYHESKELFSRAFSEFSGLLSNAVFFLKYFENLKKIENFYKVRFANIHIDEINDSAVKTVEFIVSVLENEYLTLDWDDELTFTLIEGYSDEHTHQLENMDKLNTPVVAQYEAEEKIELHGREINLGYKKMAFQDIFIINLVDILNKKDNIARVKSRSKKVYVSYTKDIKEESVKSPS